MRHERQIGIFLGSSTGVIVDALRDDGGGIIDMIMTLTSSAKWPEQGAVEKYSIRTWLAKGQPTPKSRLKFLPPNFTAVNFQAGNMYVQAGDMYVEDEFPSMNIKAYGYRDCVGELDNPTGRRPCRKYYSVKRWVSEGHRRP